MKTLGDFNAVVEANLAKAQTAKDTLLIFGFFYDGSEIVGDIAPDSMIAIENGETFTRYTASEFCYAIECKMKKGKDLEVLTVAYETMCKLIQFCS